MTYIYDKFEIQNVVLFLLVLDEKNNKEKKNINRWIIYIYIYIYKLKIM